MNKYIRNTEFWSNLSIAKHFWKQRVLCYFTNDNYHKKKEEIKKIHLLYFRKFCFLTAYFQSNRRCILEEFTHQNNYIEFFKKIKDVKKKNNISVFDVGGNVGWFTLFFSLFLNKKTKYFVFEPLKENLDILRKNLQKNKINAKIFPVALSNKKKKSNLFVFSTSGATINSLETKYLKKFYKNHNRLLETSSEKVNTTSLDNLFNEKKITKIDLLKIDAEGEEENIIKGAKKIISLSNPVILCAYEHVSNSKKRIISLIKSIDNKYEFIESKSNNKILCFFK